MTENLEPNQPPNADQQLRTGTTLANRYLIQGVIGVGGMGAVYRARDLHFPNVEKRVAVKEMVIQTHDPSMRETIVRNFEREANILATLSHPAIPRIYDYFTQSDRSYLVEEFIEGKDLEAVLNEAKAFFSEAQVVTWAIELCDVLHYLHNHKPDPIIFRDMKPSNIMIDPNQHIVLVDFGIAKPFQVGPKGTMIGTEGYSPPEQYRGEASPQSDLFALGATLHHVLTRRDPRLEAPFSFAERPIRQINPNVSVELETVVFTALHYNPENRFKSAQEMKEAMVVMAIRTGVLSRGAAAAASSRKISSDSVKALWSFECEDEIRGTPASFNGAIYIGCYDNNLYALKAATGEFIWKYATEGGIVSRPLIHDGNVFFGSEDKRLHVVDCRLGKLVWTYPTEGPIRSSPSILQGYLFIGSDDGYLHTVNAITGRRTWRADTGAPVRSTPLIINDRVVVGSESGELVSFDLGGSAKWRFKAKRAITSSPITSEGMIFFTSLDWTLYALDAKSGWIIWRYRLGKPSISTPCTAENFVFTGAVDGKIYCLDLRTAKEIWTYQTDHQVTGSPVVYKDSIYCGSVDGALYCLEYRTGRLRWKFKSQGPITGTPAIANEVVYVGSTDHKIYALPV